MGRAQNFDYSLWSLEYVNLRFGELWDVYAFLEKEKKKITNKVSSTPLRSVGDNLMSCEGDDPCTCAGIKRNGIRNKNFLGDFSQPLVTGELLDFKKKR